MHLLGISSEAKFILLGITIALDVFWLKLWRLTVNLPTLLDYTYKQKVLKAKSSWILAWFVLIYLVAKFG